MSVQENGTTATPAASIPSVEAQVSTAAPEPIRDPLVTAAPQVLTPAPVVTAPAVREDATIGNGKNLVLPREAFNARLKSATEKGKRSRDAEFAAQLKAAGFSSFEEMLAAVASAKAATAAPAAEPEKPKSASPDKRAAREIERERVAREQERKARIKAERQYKSLESEKYALQAEMAIRETAIMAGVKDVDYAVALLRRHAEGKTPEELEKEGFDEVKFFEELKEKKPYLFNETVRTVTTGTGGKEPPAPRPGTVHKSSAQNEQPDVKKMDRQQFEAHLQRMGLRPPSHIV